MKRPVPKTGTSPISQNGTGEDLGEELATLELRLGRALRCGLNKIIEPSIDEELQDTIRTELYILASARSTARILLGKPDGEERRAVATKLIAFVDNWVADGALRWVGDLTDLDHAHLSPGQH